MQLIQQERVRRYSPGEARALLKTRETRRCVGVGQAFGPIAASNYRGSDFRYLSGNTSLVAYHDAQKGAVTMLSALVAGGVVPPALTVTWGALPYEIAIAVNTPGTRSTAKLDITVNGTLTMSAVTTAATISITGTDSAVLNCPTGTYDITDTWASAVDQLGDLVGSYTMATLGGTTGQAPLYKASSFFGRPNLSFNGSSNFLRNTALAQVTLTGNDPPFTIYWIGKINRLSQAFANNMVLAATHSTAGPTATPAVFINTKVDDSSINAFKTENFGAGPFETFGVNPVTTGSWIIELSSTGTTGTIWVGKSDGSTATATHSLNTGSLTLDRYVLGANYSNAAQNFSLSDLAAHAIYNVQLSSTARTQIRAALRSSYFGL